MPICTVVGARPNFMKAAPVLRELTQRGLEHFLVHTGQHYDSAMSDVFFNELRMPRPDVHLGVGPGTHAEQTAAVLVGIERVCRERRPDLVLVVGDVNSTVATALAAVKLGIPVGHVEAGLRSFDRRMPEEINRIVTDQISDLLFLSEQSGEENLLREGVPPERIHFVGNCMVDTLLGHVDAAVAAAPWRAFGLDPWGFALLTLHRPSNVDDEGALRRLLEIIDHVARRLPVLFSVHPRTADRLSRIGSDLPSAVRHAGPLPYLAFLGLMARARCVLTDSGGIQEETTALGVPCLTLRENTERPATVTLGTNRLVGTDASRIEAAIEVVLSGRWPTGSRPPLWDGRAAARIVDIIRVYLKRPL
jgi:UDP-N-acetylglucosamine 2-epimerase (non-hydrolysing)